MCVCVCAGLACDQDFIRSLGMGIIVERPFSEHDLTDFLVTVVSIVLL